MRAGEAIDSSLSASSAGSEEREPVPAVPATLAPRTWAIALLLAIGYYAGVQVGLAFTLAPNATSILWPPNAILLAALLLMPVRTWWLLIAAVFPAHLIAEWSQGVPLMMTACWFVSNVSEALLGAAVMLAYLGRAPRFDRVADFCAFLVVGVVFAPLLSSFLDAAFVAFVGWRYNGDYWTVWRMRVFSNALATLTLVPLIVIWFGQRIRPLRRAAYGQYAEMIALLAGICLTSVLVFHQSHALGQSAVLMYAPLPFLMWAAVRRGVSGVSLCVAIVAVFAITGAMADRGPFTADTPEVAAFSIQVFLIIAASSLMLLAASLAELRHARAVALRQKESLDLALSAAQMGTWDWDIVRDRITWQLGGHATATPLRVFSQPMKSLLDRVHADDRGMVERAIDNALKRGESGEVECRFLCRDGVERWVSSKGRVLLDDKGEPQRMIGVNIDTTLQKEQEIQTRAQREQLAHLSRVSILGELSGALAHELNQPLTAILINAQVARRGIEGPAPDLREIADILSDIISEDQRAGEVIRRLRALFMRGAVQMRRVNVNECIREVLALEHSDLISRNVMADVQLAPDIPPVMADRVQLQQVLLNLVVNACDAMAECPADQRRLRITSVRNADDGVEIRICDSGHGVPDRDKVFEPFFSTKDRGVGLGLAICRTIISAHRGRLWAGNNPTVGATFHIWMPAAPEPTQEIDSVQFQAFPAQ